MRRFWKILKRVVLVLAGLLFLFLVILWYRSSRAYNHTAIAANAEKILKINVDRLALNYVYHSIIHPGASGKDREKTKDSLLDGISVPAHVFVYTVKGKKETTLFTSLPVDDIEVLRNYLLNKFKFTEKPGKDLTEFEKDNGLVQVAFTSERIMIAYSATRENVSDVFRLVLLDDKVLRRDATLFRNVKEADGEITLVDASGTKMQMELSAGKIDLEIFGDWKFKPVQGNQMASKEFTKTDGVAAFISLNSLPEFSGEEIKLKEYAVATDSMNAYIKAMQLLLKGTTVQSQESITYEYNDDFEKVPVVTMNTVEIPNIDWKTETAGNANKLLRYLTSTGLLNENTVNQEVFPLYKLYSAISRNTLSISTNSTADTTFTSYHTPGIGYGYINFPELLKYKELEMASSYFPELLELEFEISANKNEAVTLTGVLRFKDSHKHPLKLLLR